MLDLDLIKKHLELNNGNISLTSKELKISYSSLYYFVRTNNIFFKLNRKPLPSKKLLEEAYGRLKTIGLVAKELSVSKQGALYAMKKHGIKYKPLTRYTCDDDFFSRDTEEAFYVAGFIAADGCVKHRKNKTGSITYEICIGLAERDRDIVYKIKNLLKANNPVRHMESKDGTKSASFTIVSKKMADDLFNRFNIVPRKSLIYQFPKQIEDSPLIHHFMRGYNDGDGSFFFNTLKKNKKTKQVFFSLRGTTWFLEKYREILEKNCNISKRTSPIRKNSNIGVLDYGGNGAITSIKEFLYKDATVYLERKYLIAQQAKINSENCASGLKRLNKIGIDELARLYSKNKSLTALASELKTSTSRLRSFFKLHNISYLKKEKNYFDENLFENLSEDSAYLIGSLIALGGIDKKEPRIKFCAKREQEILKIKNILKYNGKIRQQKSKYYFIIFSRKIKEDLINNFNLYSVMGNFIPRAIEQGNCLSHFKEGFHNAIK